MKSKKIILSFFLLALVFQKTKSQDIHFSQFFETPLLQNPALAGLFNGDVRVQTVYRSQWNNITDAYKTGSLSAEFKKPIGNNNDYVTLATQILYDKAGTVALTSTHILPAFNYHKSLSTEKNRYLSLGFTAGYVQRSIDRSKITTNSQYNGSSYDPSAANGETFTKNKYAYFDASVGMSYNSQLGENTDNNLYLGLAYHHLNKAKKQMFYATDTYELLPKWIASAGLRMNINEQTYFTLEANYIKQSVYQETIIGTLFSYKLDDWEQPLYLLHAGVYLRWGDAAIPVIKIERKPFSLALSYDANISALKTASQGRGGFELSLSYSAFNNHENSTINAVRCPKF